VSGTVNPQGTDTHYYFQYGPSTAYGAKTTSTDAGAGTADVPVTANLTGLGSGTIYHYQLVAVNSAGDTTVGADQTFTTTTPPTVTTGSASKTTRASATLNGTVNPQSQATTYYFRYGTTTSYGLQTSPASVGSGSAVVAVNANISGLTADTTYHYQLVATNNDYSMPADSGGFHNMVLNQTGKTELGQNSTFHLLAVTVNVTGSTGQKVSYVIHLARWVWH
jgi:hypothetical protein